MSSLNINNLSELESFVDQLSPEIGSLGGRYFVKRGENTKVRMDDLVEAIQRQATERQATANQGDRADIARIAGKITELDRRGNAELERQYPLVRLLTKIRQLLGHRYKDRNAILEGLRPQKNWGDSTHRMHFLQKGAYDSSFGLAVSYLSPVMQQNFGSGAAPSRAQNESTLLDAVMRPAREKGWTFTEAEQNQIKENALKGFLGGGVRAFSNVRPGEISINSPEFEQLYRILKDEVAKEFPGIQLNESLLKEKVQEAVETENRLRNIIW